LLLNTQHVNTIFKHHTIVGTFDSDGNEPAVSRQRFLNRASAGGNYQSATISISTM